MFDRWRTQRAMARQMVQIWDDLATGARHNADAPSSDPPIRHTVLQIMERDDALAIDPAFSATLMAQLTSPSAHWASQTPAPARMPINQKAMKGRALPAAEVRPFFPGFSRLRGAGAAVSMALLLLLIGAGFFLWNANREPVPAVIPLQLETTESGVAIEALLEEEIPAGRLPQNTTNQIGAGEFVIEPGEALSDAPRECDDVPVQSIGYVESGEIALRATGQLELTRDSGEPEIIPAGREVRLGTGDSWVYHNDTSGPKPSVTNMGAAPAHVLESSWWLDTTCTVAGPMLHWGDAKYVYDFDRTRPVSITIHHVSIPAGTVLTPDDAASIGLAENEDDIFRVAGVEVGTLVEAWAPDALTDAALPRVAPELISRLEAGQAWTSSLNLSPPEGKERQFSAGGEESLELTIFSFVYDDAVDRTDGEGDPTDGGSIERLSLLDHAFPADVVPRNDASSLVVSKVVVPAGEAVFFPEHCGAPTLVAAAVVSGTYSVHPRALLQVTRASGTEESIAADSDVKLTAGDSFVYVNESAESMSGFRNGGSETLVVLQANWFPDVNCVYRPMDSGVGSQIAWMASDRLGQAEHTPPFHLQIQRANLGDLTPLQIEDVIGTAIPLLPTENRGYLVVESGTAYVKASSKPGTVTPYVWTDIYSEGEVLTLDGLMTSTDSYGHEIGVNNGSVELILITIIYEQPDSG